MRFYGLALAAIMLWAAPGWALQVLQVSRQVTTRGKAPVLRLYPGTGLNISFLETDETVYKIWFDDPSWATLDVEGSLEGDQVRGAKIIHLKRTQDLLYEHNIASERTTLTLVTDQDIHRFVVVKAEGTATYDTISIVRGQSLQSVQAEALPAATVPFPPPLPGSEDFSQPVPPPPTVEVIAPADQRRRATISPAVQQTNRVIAPADQTTNEGAGLGLEQQLVELEAQLQAQQSQARKEKQEKRRQVRRARREKARRARVERRRAKQQAKIERLRAQIAALQGEDAIVPVPTVEKTTVVIEAPPTSERNNPAWQAVNAAAGTSTKIEDKSPWELAHLLTRGVNIARTLPQPEIEFSRRRYSNWSKIQRVIRRLKRGSDLEAAVAAERINPSYVRDILTYGLQR